MTQIESWLSCPHVEHRMEAAELLAVSMEVAMLQIASDEEQS